MVFFESFNANFFSVGALIPTVFNLFLALLFLVIREKSRSTFHIGISLLLLSVFNLAYFIAGSFYHPWAAYHRWITTGVILLIETHFTFFIYHIGREERTPVAAWLFRGMYGVSIVMAGVFYAFTWNAEKVFIVSAHQWDFAADRISGVFGAVIMAYMIIFVAVMSWKLYDLRGRDFWPVFSMSITYLVSGSVPTVVNMLSRSGVIERGLYQVVWDLFIIFGFFIIAIIYLNYTADRTSVMAKITGISIVTMLVMLQGFSYYSFTDQERSYDTVHAAYALLSTETERHQPGTSYVVRYSSKDKSDAVVFMGDREIPPSELAAYRDERANTALYERISRIPDEAFEKQIIDAVRDARPQFAGYKMFILTVLQGVTGNGARKKHAVLAALGRIERAVRYHHDKIEALPEDGFREAVNAHLDRHREDFYPFAQVMASHVKHAAEEGAVLKRDVLAFVAPIADPSKRQYRMLDSGLFVSFLCADRRGMSVCEAGFPYLEYRAYLHPSSMKFIWGLLIIMTVVILGYSLFFRGVLIGPISILVRGLGEVGGGNLDVAIPVRYEDEIGFMVRSFNAMAEALRDARSKLDSYADELEQRVSARTQELQESEARYKNILASIGEGYYEVNLQGGITFINNSITRILGYSLEEVLTMNYSQFMPDKDVGRKIFGIFNTIFQTGEPSPIFEWKVLRKDGSVKMTEGTASLIRDADGKPAGFRGMLRDISEKLEAEEALHRSEKKFQSIISTIQEGIYESDLKGNFTFVNDAIARFFGFSKEEMLGRNVASIVPPGTIQSVFEIYNEVYTTGRRKELVVFEIVRLDGERRYAEHSIELITGPGGEKSGFRGVSRDITARKKAEDALVELDRQKSMFFANISHEIRTPLTLMLSPIESVMQGEYGKNISRDFFKGLHRNGVRLLKLINNLLDFSKIEAGRMMLRVQETDVVRFMRTYVGAVQSAAESKHVSLKFEPAAETVLAWLDLDKFEKIVMNLFSNALKYTGPAGKITVSVVQDGSSCAISFEDTGEGIPAEGLERIFDRFGQADTGPSRRHEGTGIGLALAREFAVMHGGTIQASSRFIVTNPDDHGSVFTVTIPMGRAHLENRRDVEFVASCDLEEAVTDRELLALDTQQEHGADGDRADPALDEAGLPVDRYRLLVVDDNPDMRNFLGFLLRKEFDVSFAVNGEEGLAAAGKRAPDLIITDVMMPVMDGYEMTRRLKSNEELAKIPVIMITAKAEIANKIEGIEHGADDYLTKPFNSRELMVRIRALLRLYDYQRLISERNQEMEYELDMARMILERLLPQRIPEVPGFRTHAACIPMDKVGGDFYDYFEQDGKLYFFIADVSGHGLHGAFLALISKMALDGTRERSAPPLALASVNRAVYRSTVNSNFVTAFFAVLDPATRRLRFSSAGHLPQIVYRRSQDRFIELKTKGMPLGWFPSVKLAEGEVTLEPGDRLLLFTDGITECLGSSRELYGEDRLMECMRRTSNASPSEFSKNLIADLTRFRGADTFNDDLTFIVMDVAG